MAGLGSSLAAQTAALLRRFGEAVRDHVISHRNVSADSSPLGMFHGDMIYGIDKAVEPVILRELRAWPVNFGRISVIAEGMAAVSIGEGGEAIKLLIDPIDGTRSLMYDKRPAWFLAAAAPDRGEATRLSHAFASVMVEIPTSKQTLADVVSWTADGGVRMVRTDLKDGHDTILHGTPSNAQTLEHGFAQVSNFFPGAKRLAADLMERIALAVVGPVRPESASVFDDQYISTGGQFVELLMGRDRFCCDLRPIFFDILARSGVDGRRGLCCHPYDAAGLPILKAAGVELTDGYGEALDAPFALDAPVHWCGYANPALRRQIEPVIQGWIAEYLSG